MIQSYAYDIIKQEGIKEGVQIGVQQGIKEGIQQGVQQGELHSKREAVCTALEELHRQAITVEDIPSFAQIIRTVLTPA